MKLISEQIEEVKVLTEEKNGKKHQRSKKSARKIP